MENLNSKVIRKKRKKESSIAESLVISKRRSQETNRTRKECYPNTRSLKMLVQELTGKEEDLSPHWKGCHVEKIEEILSSIGIDFVRFGFELIETICKFNRTSILVHNRKDETYKSGEKELAEDLMAIVTVYACREMGKEDIEDITFRSRSIKMTPSKAQKKILKEGYLMRDISIIFQLKN